MEKRLDGKIAHFKEKQHKQVTMRKKTEDYMLSHSVSEMKTFIIQNSEIEEDEGENAMFIPHGEHKFVKGKTYQMKGNDFQGDEFIITEEGRVFYALSLIENIEIVDAEEIDRINERYGDIFEQLRYCNSQQICDILVKAQNSGLLAICGGLFDEKDADECFVALAIAIVMLKTNNLTLPEKYLK